MTVEKDRGFYGDKTAMSSLSDEWGTPADLIAFVNRAYPLDLDACATAQNAKAPRYYTRDQNGLQRDWHGNVWCNPPYGNAEQPCDPVRCELKRCEKRGFHTTEYKPGIADWVAKMIIETGTPDPHVRHGIVLLPARTETNWFEKCWQYADELLFITGRLTFEGEGGKWPAPFPSVLAFFTLAGLRRAKPHVGHARAADLR